MKEQIEEIDELTTVLYEANHKKSVLDYRWLATEAYNAGYRKQEWISVEDRLPTWEDGKVLIYTTHGISIAQRTTSERWQGDLAKPKWITHWMPLPEPPKMKGG